MSNLPVRKHPLQALWSTEFVCFLCGRCLWCSDIAAFLPDSLDFPLDATSSATFSPVLQSYCLCNWFGWKRGNRMRSGWGQSMVVQKSNWSSNFKKITEIPKSAKLAVPIHASFSNSNYSPSKRQTPYRTRWTVRRAMKWEWWKSANEEGGVVRDSWLKEERGLTSSLLELTLFDGRSL